MTINLDSSDFCFASCNRQNRPQDFWHIISMYKPKTFLWTGDSVYASNTSLNGVIAAYGLLASNSLYKRFANSTIIDGVWDDHDYGVNDGGRYVNFRRERQQAFLDFLGIDSESVLRYQEGIYHYSDHVINSLSIRIIFLDTRFQRDSHWIRSLGEIHFPFTALAAAALRVTYTLLGFGRNFSGDVLGDDQWIWLEETLKSSTADAHILVSSIQVLTTNPVVESWGHFPIAKRRLLRLIQDIDPPGLVLISGDVHHAEISQVPVLRMDGTRTNLIEVTSSGLTHTCTDTSLITQSLCPLMLNAFSSHRVNPTAYYMGRNFGHIRVFTNDSSITVADSAAITREIITSSEPVDGICEHNETLYSSNSSNSNSYLRIFIRDVYTGHAKLSTDIPLTRTLYNGRRSPIISISYPDLPTYPTSQIILFSLFLSIILFRILVNLSSRNSY